MSEVSQPAGGRCRCARRTRSSAAAASVHCDKVVHPSSCLARSCPFVYAYEEHGHTFMGCMQRIFEVEIDLDMLQRGRAPARGLRRGEGAAQPAADVPLRGRAVLREPLRRARLRQSRVQRAAGGIADVRVFARLRGLASGTRRSRRTPSTGPTAETANASRHESARRNGERGRHDRAEHAEHRLLEAERGAAAGRARPLRRGGEREPVPRSARARRRRRARARARRAARRRALRRTSIATASAVPTSRSGAMRRGRDPTTARRRRVRRCRGRSCRRAPPPQRGPRRRGARAGRGRRSSSSRSAPSGRATSRRRAATSAGRAAAADVRGCSGARRAAPPG